MLLRPLRPPLHPLGMLLPNAFCIVQTSTPLHAMIA
jgi:hypothetical protein